MDDHKRDNTVGPKGTMTTNEYLDEIMDESFPASDPPANTGMIGPTGIYTQTHHSLVMPSHTGSTPASIQTTKISIESTETHTSPAANNSLPESNRKHDETIQKTLITKVNNMQAIADNITIEIDRILSELAPE
jgi:hypothetical protein